MFEGSYYIDVGKDNNGFKLIIRDTSGNIAKVFNDSLALVQGAWNEVSQLIENYHLMIYGRIKTYRDGDVIFDLFKRFLFVIFLEQDASYLASLDGYKIKYPDFTYYIATLYKMYKAFVNPKSTLDPQEFIAIISPLITKASPDLSGLELVALFDTFASNYYKAIDYISKERIGLNFMPTVEKPINEEPNTAATQPNEIAIKPSTTVTQPNIVTTPPQPVINPTPKVVPPPSPAPQQPAPKEIPPKSPEVTKSNIEKTEENKPKIELEHKRPTSD